MLLQFSASELTELANGVLKDDRKAIARCNAIAMLMNTSGHDSGKVMLMDELQKLTKFDRQMLMNTKLGELFKTT